MPGRYCNYSNREGSGPDRRPDGTRVSGLALSDSRSPIDTFVILVGGYLGAWIPSPWDMRSESQPIVGSCVAKDLSGW